MNSNMEEEDDLFYFVIPTPISSHKEDIFRVWVCVTKECPYTDIDIWNILKPFSRPSVGLWNNDNSVIYSWECPESNLSIIRHWTHTFRM